METSGRGIGIPHVYMRFRGTQEQQDAPDGQKWDGGHADGHELLCRGLAELYGLRVRPEELPDLLDTGAHGKPFLKERPDIHFNISHCRGAAVCAFSDTPVGTDVEGIRPVRQSVIGRVLHEREQELLEYCREEDGEDAARRLFFRYWTLKESYLKQKGAGLSMDPASVIFEVDLDDTWFPVLCSDPDVFCWQQETRGGQILAVCLPKDGSGPVELSPRPVFREVP